MTEGLIDERNEGSTSGRQAGGRADRPGALGGDGRPLEEDFATPEEGGESTY